MFSPGLPWLLLSLPQPRPLRLSPCLAAVQEYPAWDGHSDQVNIFICNQVGSFHLMIIPFSLGAGLGLKTFSTLRGTTCWAVFAWSCLWTEQNTSHLASDGARKAAKRQQPHLAMQFFGSTSKTKVALNAITQAQIIKFFNTLTHVKLYFYQISQCPQKHMKTILQSTLMIRIECQTDMMPPRW